MITTILCLAFSLAVNGAGDGNGTPADVAAAEIERFGGLVRVKTSQSGEQHVEVIIRGSRSWKGEKEGFKHLAALANLRSLHIYGNDQFGDQEIIHLRGLTELRSLSLLDTQVTDDGLVHLSDLTSLESLSLSSSKFTDRAWVHVEGLDKLKSLRFDGSQITDHGLLQLKRSKLLDRLEFLSLNRCKNITDAGLRHLKHMSHLKALFLSDTQVSDSGLSDQILTIRWRVLPTSENSL